MASGGGADFNSDDKADSEPVIVFQCGSCFRILGDSVSWISSNTELKTISLSVVTNTLHVGKSIKISEEELDAGSTYVLLRCAGCKADVGKLYKSTVKGIDDLRGLYTLNVDSLVSYQLSSPAEETSIEDHHKYIHNNKFLFDQMLKLEGLLLHLNTRLSAVEDALQSKMD